MTSRFTSRFRRRDEAAASASTEAEKPAVDAAKDAPKTDETKAEAVKAETAPEAKPTETPAAPKQVVPPSRLVEVEKPKASRPDLTQAKMWLDQANAYRVPASIAAALLVALGLGYGIGTARAPAGSAQTASLLETTTRELRDANGQIGQLAAELKAVKGTVDGIKGERDRTRGEVLAKQAQLSDRFDRSGQENATRIGRLAEQLDRIEKAQRDPGRQGTLEKSVAEKPEKVAERAEKPEKVAAAAPTPPARPPLDVAHTGSIGEAKPAEKPDPRKTPLEGFVVRDYDEGFALIETRAGRYIDVAVGYHLPGAGRVEAIERRGRQWVVITPKGYIGER